jgi:triphosphoribosyl-dephospho-CoA synthase
MRLNTLGHAATVALYDELALYPKPGLVSLVDTGSHSDMHAGTFLRSLFALRHAFKHLAHLGSQHAPFSALEQAGIEAERRMLRATQGINTHRGAIFNLGLLCAAAGALLTEGQTLAPTTLQTSLRRHWGAALMQRRSQSRQRATHGQRVALTLGLRSAEEEACAGMPVLFDVAVPALMAAKAAGLSPTDTRLHTFFHILATLDDTNLAHRGGLAGLRHAQQQARDFLADGGMHQPHALRAATAMHHAFVAQRWSPGGSADVLAAACWIERVCRAEPCQNSSRKIS